MIEMSLFKTIFSNILKKKKTRIYIILFSIMMILSLGVLVFKNNVCGIINATKNNQIDYRTIRVFSSNINVENKEIFIKQLEKNINSILNIKHVQDAYIGEESALIVKTNLKNTYVDGTITVLRGTDSTLPKIIEGRAFSNNESGVMICPQKFYPDSEPEKIKRKGIIDAKTLLNKKINITYNEYKYDEFKNKLIVKEEHKKEFEIVGLYDTQERMNDNGTCYISSVDMKEMAATEYSWDESAYISSSILVVVDSINNVEPVKEELANKGYKLSGVEAYLDYNIINIIMTLIICAMLLILLIVILLSILYLVGIDNSEEKEIKKLILSKSKIKDTKVYFIIENIVINMIAYIIGLIIFFILFKLCIENLEALTSLKYMIGGFKIGLDSVVIAFILIVVVPSIINFVYFKMSSNKFLKIKKARIF